MMSQGLSYLQQTPTFQTFLDRRVILEDWTPHIIQYLRMQ